MCLWMCFGDGEDKEDKEDGVGFYFALGNLNM